MQGKDLYRKVRRATRETKGQLRPVRRAAKRAARRKVGRMLKGGV